MVLWVLSSACMEYNRLLVRLKGMLQQFKPEAEPTKGYAWILENERRKEKWKFNLDIIFLI